jgi:hypothetical protein
VKGYLSAPPLFGSCASLGGQATAAEKKKQSVCFALFPSLRLAFVRFSKCLFPLAFDVARDKLLSVIRGILPALKIFIVADYKNNYHRQSLNK